MCKPTTEVSKGREGILTFVDDLDDVISARVNHRLDRRRERLVQRHRHARKELPGVLVRHPHARPVAPRGDRDAHRLEPFVHVPVVRAVAVRGVQRARELVHVRLLASPEHLLRELRIISIIVSIAAQHLSPTTAPLSLSLSLCVSSSLLFISENFFTSILFFGEDNRVFIQCNLGNNSRSSRIVSTENILVNQKISKHCTNKNAKKKFYEGSATTTEPPRPTFAISCKFYASTEGRTPDLSLFLFHILRVDEKHSVHIVWMSERRQSVM